MSDWLAFEGRIETVAWGDKTYTVLPLPPEVATPMKGVRRVEGEIAEHPVNLAIARAPVVAGPFLWTGKSLLARLGVVPGEVLEVRLRPASDDEVALPEDVAAALRAAGATADWEALTPGRRRGLLYRVSTAKRAETRMRRIAELIAGARG